MGDERPTRMMALIEELYPICRSIMGPGTRATLDIIGSRLPIERPRVPTGTPVLDWVVPEQWQISDAYITRAGADERLIDFADHNLHVVSHSVPVDEVMSLDALQSHLHSLPDRPQSIPYRTAYYSPAWGFCLTDHQRRQLEAGEYHVVIDSQLSPGHLEWGELVIAGDTTDEVLITTHICHPSLANDNLTGIAALVELADHIRRRPNRRYTYRLLFLPGTIGSIGWLATSTTIERIAHGLVLTGLGDSSAFTYKQSRNGSAEIDRIASVVLAHHDGSAVVAFSPYGYDERQFCSPGFDLPVGRLTRGVHGQYPEYHTSADDLDFVSGDRLDESVEILADIIDALEANRRYRNLFPYGEPQLGRRGLYSTTGGAIDQRSVEMAYLWVLSGSDGSQDLCEIAARSAIPFDAVVAAAQRLVEAGVIDVAP